MMGDHIASSVFNTLALAFFVVVSLGIALGVYAALQIKKTEESEKE